MSIFIMRDVMVFPNYIKKCIKCKDYKVASEFYKRNTSEDGYRNTCKQCIKKLGAERYDSNKEAFKTKSRDYRKHNKNKCKECMRDYRSRNKEYFKEYNYNYRNRSANYARYSHQLTVDEDSRLSPDGITLECRCKYCGNYYAPTNDAVHRRIGCIKGRYKGECHLYCSINCKKSCGTYRKIRHTGEFKSNTSREVQPHLRKMVLDRDGYRCIQCSNTSKEQPLHCHHLEGVEINPIMSADMDLCITLCKSCHNKLHKERHCDMRRGKCK